MRNFLLDKKNLFIVFLLLLITLVLNWFVFSKQLNYGLRDVDWMVLYFYKFFGSISLHHLWEEIKELGVYASESYYVGILEQFIGLNFIRLHLVTHVFKIFSAIAVYFLIMLVFKRRLLAFITSIIYTISYTHAGVLFQLASGAYFITTLFMALFLISYYYSLSRKNFLRWSLAAGILLIVTFLLKPERMYPLVPLVLSVELFVVVFGKFKKNILVASCKRTMLILLPLAIPALFYRAFLEYFPLGLSPSQFSIVANLRLESIAKGNLQLSLYPFASFGSIFLFEDYWKWLGQLNFQNFSDFLFSLIFGPIVRLGALTFILLSFTDKTPLRRVLLVTVLVFIFGITIYALNINWQNISAAARIHFDPNLIGIPAIFGFYIFILSCLFFFKLIRSHDLRFAPLVVGFYFAFLFILLTWIPSDIQLTFMGPQRYLSIPSIGTSLFMAGVMVIIFDRLRETKSTKNFALISFLILIPIIYINYQVANKFFDYELTYAGVRGSEQTRMKSKFRQLTGNINKEENSLFYFDETADKDHGYFDEGTVEAGFEFWIRINPDGTLNDFPEPGMMRTNVQCPEHTHQNCISLLKSGLSTKDGQRGIWYKDPIRGNINRFYTIDNFYAFRFINKNIIDITQEVLYEFGPNLRVL